ncbi:MAG: LysE family translocator [Gammaproteobacteria bacterium]|nr:LysE family translocator [Gammaproteobacteria bacterium]
MDMGGSWLSGLASLAFVTSITPGPNNFMLMSSGLRFGLIRSLPHLLGVAVGFAGLLITADLGLGFAVARYPAVARGLALACALYLCWLAWGLLRAPPHSATSADSSQPVPVPMRLWQAALFQWANPKAWSMAVAGAAIAAQSGLESAVRTALLVVVFVAITLPCILAWTAAGSQLRRLLQRPRAYRAFSIVMAVALVLTAVWMLQGQEPSR